MDSTDNLLAKLLELGATLRPPPSVEEITNAENILKSRFPDGIREFYRFCNGVKETTKEEIWDFYTLEYMIEQTLRSWKWDSFSLYEGEVLHLRDFICFCDVLIQLVTYHFCGNPKSENYGRFYAVQASVGGIESPTGWLVAQSYEEFVQVFLEQNGEILLNNV